MTTLDAHIVALNMKTGGVVWDVAMADYKQGHASTIAPLVVKDKVIVGVVEENSAFAALSTPTT